MENKKRSQLAQDNRAAILSDNKAIYSIFRESSCTRMALSATITYDVAKTALCEQ